MVETIISQVDLVDYVEKYEEMTPTGDTFRGVCPICRHPNNSEFVIYNHRTFHCWACGKSGDVINLVRELKSVDFFTAVEFLADELNIDIKRKPDYAEKKQAALDMRDKILEFENNFKSMSRYVVDERKISENTAKAFHLGANNGAVVIPFINENDLYVGYAQRRFEGAKYINTKNNSLFTKSEFLFGLRQAKEKLDNVLFMVEGYFCAMTLWQDGKAAVAYNSSQPTKQQLMRIKKLAESNPELTVMLIPDNDKPAQNLLPKVRANIQRFCPKVAFMVVRLPEGAKDVNDLYAKENKTLAEAFVVSLDLAALDVLLSKCSSIAAERKTAESFAKTVRDELVLSDIASYLAGRWDMDIKVVRDFLHVKAEELDDDFKGVDKCIEDAIKLIGQTPIEYGFTVIDNGINGGARLKDVTFIGGYSSSGKTALICQMCLDMVVRQKLNVLFFSLEMDAGALYERLISGLIGKPTPVIDKMISSRDPLIYSIRDKLQDRLFVVDKNSLTIADLDKYIKMANAKIFDDGVDVVFIDYIQYMKDCSQYNVLAETAKGMKPLAKDNNIHVVVLSQLNRDSDIWTKPNMANLKGGGDLEASADNILLLWRPSMNPDLSPQERAIIENELMVAIGKARRGSRINEIKLVYDKQISRYVIPEK